MAHIRPPPHGTGASADINAMTIQEMLKDLHPGSFTIAAGAATTVVSDDRVGEGTLIQFSAQDANGATKIAAGGFYIVPVSAADATAKQFTVTHANDATAGTITYTIHRA